MFLFCREKKVWNKQNVVYSHNGLLFSLRSEKLFKIFIGIKLLYKAMLVSNVEQSESVTHICSSPLLGLSFPFRWPQSIEKSSLCSAVDSHSSSVLQIASAVCTRQPPSPSSSQPAFPLGIHTFVLSVE